eukprot:NODE_403_length_9316_cov_0.901269.p3 type:complete len:155 gc:universal NODE_403_length_9316_cov_0.901269:2735-3199(+)
MSLDLHNYRTDSKTRITKQGVVSNWKSVNLYKNGDTIEPEIMYRLSYDPSFPSIDYVPLLNSIYYGIQVSVTPIREKHDSGESVDTRIQRGKQSLGFDEQVAFKYVYLSITQNTTKDGSYVPYNAPGHLNAGTEVNPDPTYMELMSFVNSNPSY